jgi:hypothetical protein
MPHPAPTIPAKLPRSAEVKQMPGTTRKGVRKPPIDLQRLKLEYEGGSFTTRELGAKYARSAASIVAYAKKFGWVQDHRDSARRKSAIIVSDPKAMAAIEAVAAEHQTDELAVVMAMVRGKHRSLIERQRAVLAKMLAEVEDLGDGQQLRELIDAVASSASDEERLAGAKAVVKKLTAMPSRVYAIFKLSAAAKNIISLERQAFDLDQPGDAAPPPPRDNSMSAAEVFAWISQQRPAPKVG